MNKRLAQGVIGAILVVAPLSGWATTAHASEYGGVGSFSSGHSYVFNPEFTEGVADSREALARLHEGQADIAQNDRAEGFTDFSQAADLANEARTDFLGLNVSLTGHFE